MDSKIAKFGHLQIPLEDVLKATNNFSDKNIIGKGGFGNVYKGRLNHNNQMIKVAARRLNRTGRLGEVEFWKEVSVLSVIKNSPHIVSMIGFCYEKDEMVIVNEHYSKASLYTHLTDPAFTIQRRLNVCKGVADAIHFIQHIPNNQSYFVVHNNINSTTILLNHDWVPKLSGFEFSIKQSVNRNNHVFRCEQAGTRGYIDPAIEKLGGVNYKSDVYSLGVVLFEIICGRKAYEEDGTLLAPLAKFYYEKDKVKDIIHPKLLNQMDPESLWRFSEVAKTAYSCLTNDQSLRPEPSQVWSSLVDASKMAYPDEMALYSEESALSPEEMAPDIMALSPKYNNLSSGETTCDIFFTHWKKKQKKKEKTWKVNTLEHLRLELKDIHSATNDFSDTSYMERVEWDYVLYKAELRCFDRAYISMVKGYNKDELPMRHYNTIIKRIKNEDYAFNKEIHILSRCNHPDIVSLLGYCDEDDEMIIVYEYISRMYLVHIFKNHSLTWGMRLKICIDVARGLRYLHDEIKDRTMVVHNNIRSDNIMVERTYIGGEELYWRPKIVGFEDSKLLPPNQDNGTHHHLHHNTEFADIVKNDIINFGIVMYEIICGTLYNRYDIGCIGREKGLADLIQRVFTKGWKQEHILSSLMKENSEKNFFLHKGPNQDSLDTFMEICCWCIVGKKKQHPTMEIVINELEKALTFDENSKDIFKMSLQDIKLATNDFANAIGEGGSAKVYTGKLVHGQDDEDYSNIVAKKLDTSHRQWEIQFYNELEILYVYKHDNIIGLVGYSKETDEKIIVYERATKGSLDRCLKSKSLTWRKRLKICLDVATGLEFLHGGIEGQAVIHRDIKAANILLFDDWKAKLGDFGLSLISVVDKETNYVIDHPCGTMDYVDPLYLKSGLLTLESDIYSLGVVLLEILCGREMYTITKPKNMSILNFTKDKFKEGNQDKMVFKAIEEEIVPKSLTTFLNIIYKCLDDDREKRPNSKEVLAEIKKALEFQDEDTILNLETT